MKWTLITQHAKTASVAKAEELDSFTLRILNDFQGWTSES